MNIKSAPFIKKVCMMFIYQCKIRFIFLTVVFLMPPPLFAGEHVNMKSGFWELSVTLEMDGQVASPSNTLNHCYTNEYIQNEIMTLPYTSMPRDKDNCTETDLYRSGDTITWRQECRGDEPMRGNGRITYQVISFNAVIENNFVAPEGKVILLISRIKGRRIGDCP